MSAGSVASDVPPGPTAEIRSRLWARFALLAVAGLAAALVLVWIVRTGGANLETSRPRDEYYNLLVGGFRSGQLSLKQQVPAGLAQLPDPYDPVANAAYRYGHPRLFDTSYYHGRLYLYFGVTPALVLFWPWVALTGHYLSHAWGVLVFVLVGFGAAVGLLHALWRRYFAEVPAAVVAAGVLALGLANAVPMLLQRPGVWEVPVTCGVALSLLALGAIWRALHEPARRLWWLAAASLLYGLGIGARPSLLFGAVILLLPVAAPAADPAAGRRRPSWKLLAAALGPIAAVGLGLLLYNWLRFGDPFELGQRYQLATDRQALVRHFSPGYFWFNWRLYFLAPMHWTRAFPFVADIPAPAVPAGHAPLVENPLSLLVNVPLVWFAVAVPLAWCRRAAEMRARLRWFLAAPAILFLNGALVICLFYTTSNRYEVDFAPYLVWLAVAGILAVERATRGWRRGWRLAVRAVWTALLAFSIVTNLLASLERGAMEYYSEGRVQLESGRPAAALAPLRAMLRISPGYVHGHIKLGIALSQLGRYAEATHEYETALRLQPDEPSAHLNYGVTLAESGRLSEAIREFRRAVALTPGDARAHFNLGLALARADHPAEAITELQAVVRLAPGEIEAHKALANLLLENGRAAEAAAEFQAALRLDPNDPALHAGLQQARAQLIWR